jgi:hypothetical protein
MSTTLLLNDDGYHAVREAAKRERRTLGDMATGLMRKLGPKPSKSSKLKGKYSLLPARDQVVTTEHVRALMDQAGI